jgi:Delta3-Delta2-enoyl-CoA isomerase
MTDSGRIGLNEVELGIPVPKFWAALMVRVVGQGIADKLCGFAQMSTPQQALNVGMIDEVVATGQLLPVSSAGVSCCLKRGC